MGWIVEGWGRWLGVWVYLAGPFGSQAVAMAVEASIRKLDSRQHEFLTKRVRLGRKLSVSLA